MGGSVILRRTYHKGKTHFVDIPAVDLLVKAPARGCAGEVASAEGVGVINVLEFKAEVALDCVIGQPNGGGDLPDIEVLAKDTGEVLRLDLRPVDKVGEGLVFLDGPDAWVGLLPFGRIGPLVPAVQLVEVPVLDRVELVNYDGVGAEAVQGAGIRGRASKVYAVAGK